MKRAGFILETITTDEGKKERRIRMYTTEETEYVTFYKDDRLIPIPYECLVCFVADNVNEPKAALPDVMRLEKLIIDTQNIK